MLGTLPTVGGLEIEAVHLAAETISGDTYDVAPIDRETVRVFVADATGHGVAAGLVTMFIKSEYEAHKRIAAGPGAVLTAMNEVLASRYANLELRFSAICADVHVRDRRLVHASAAHPGPALLRAHGATLLPGGGTFVGLMPGVAYADEEAALEPGDALVFFTDGLLDATAPGGAPLGERRALEMLAAAHRARAGITPALVRGLSAFVGEGRALEDDVTLVAITLG
jgi:sigma-B regulation protein RsbU (phosphoserine phosphatase)